MRHNKQKSPSFGRHRGPRKALIRGLINSLVEQERIKTTVTKAKCVRPLIEKAITMGKTGDVHSHRLLFSRYPNKNTVDKIIKNLSPRFKDRPGGYTRIIKIGYRPGDQAPLAYIEFVDYSTQQQAKPQKEAVKVEKPKKTEKEEQAEPKKKTATKKARAKASAITDKKQKKQLLAKLDKKRKKARLKQKKSRRINR